MTNRLFAWLDARVASLEPRWLFLAILLANVVVLAFIGFAWVAAPNSARFTIEAETEIAYIKLPTGRSSFDWGDAPVDPSSIEMLPDDCTSPVLDLAQPLDGPVDMVAKVDPTSKRFSVTLERPAGASVGSVLCSDGRSVDGGRFIRLVWPSDPARRVTLRFLGQVAVGDMPAAMNPSQLLLRSGTITSEALGWPSGDGGVSRQSKLYPGDSVRIYTQAARKRSNLEQDQALSHGLLQVRGGDVISVTAHADAREVRVIRVGQEGETATSIVPSFWDRFQAQSGWALLIVLGAIGLNLLNALRSYRQELLATVLQPEPEASEE